MDLVRDLFLFGSAVAAGGINSVAGGGTLLSFPAAIAAGMPPLVANATNAVALALAIPLQLLVGIYGGYCGGAMGIVMLAYLAVLGGMDIHQMNAIKNVLSALVNGCAAVYFVVERMVDFRAAGLMAAGAIVGG